MTSPTSPSRLTAETLKYLSDIRVPVGTIDDAIAAERFDAKQLVMTSMGNRRRAIVTPAYPAFQFENALQDRLSWAAVWDRPLIEAQVSLHKTRPVATVLLRQCLLTGCRPANVLETAWQYELHEPEPTETFEDVVDAVANVADCGSALVERSGIVMVDDARRQTANWKVSTPAYPEEVASIIHATVRGDVAFVTSL